MPWIVSWLDDEHTVIVLQPHDPWTWDELQQASERAQAMTTAQSDTVDLIFQLGGELKLPEPRPGETRVAPWLPLREMLLNSPPNRGVVVLESAPLFVESIVSVVKTVMKDHEAPKNIIFAATMREAQDLIRARRATGRKPSEA